MCKYCDKTFTGDANIDLSSGNVEINGRFFFGSKTYIDCFKNEYPIIVTNVTDEFDRYFVSALVRIQYCPVCGRKLLKESV